MFNRLKRRPLLVTFFLIQFLLFSTYTYVFYRPNDSKDDLSKTDQSTISPAPAHLPASFIEKSNRILVKETYKDVHHPKSPQENNTSIFEKLKQLNVSFIVEETNHSNFIIQCPMLPKNLVGRVEADLFSYNMQEIEQNHANASILLGGHWFPLHCTARHRVAVIIPYRNREMQQRVFLNFMHPFLQKQELDYQIFFVEPENNVTFNRALLFNIGFREALKEYAWQCFIFHDVDLIPEDDRNIYSCPPEPRHMSVAVNTMNYELPYRTLFGGVSALTKEQFESVNGFSNQYFGWGGEDDDMAARVLTKYRISRYPTSIARYKMLRHKPDTPNKSRYATLGISRAIHGIDGLSNLKYEIIEIRKEKLFTLIHVTYDEKTIRSGIANITNKKFPKRRIRR